MPSSSVSPCSPDPSFDTDVLIVGAGPAGLSLAVALAQTGWRATVLEQQGEGALARPAPDGREIALTHPSVATLQRLGSWQRLAPHEIGLLRQAQVHDGPVGQREGMALNAQGTGCDNLGWIVPNHALRRTAWAVAAATAGVRLITGVKVTRVSTTPARAELEYVDAATPDATPQRLQAPLLVAADSRFSATRRQLGIGASMHDFGRTVIVCRLRHERAHDGIAHECFGYERTLAILPLPDDTDSGAPMCSAVVTARSEQVQALLALSPEDFAACVQEQFNHRLGRMQLVGQRHAYPLVAVMADRFAAARCALVGDAAVGMHPVTAHGFNFGLRGIATLAGELRAAHAAGQDIAAPQLLARYERAHRRATLPLYLATTFIARLYTTDNAPARLVRDAALRLAQSFPPFKRMVAATLSGRH